MLISIVVPVYNVDVFLRDCIESILGQTFKNFELLLVNDGSTDNSGVICDEYAENHEQVKVFHINNIGVSGARNLGISNANGKWICFVDSDDVVLPTYLEKLFFYSEGSDLVINGVTILDTIKNSKKSIEPKIIGIAMSNERIDILHNVPMLCLASPVSKLFRRKILQQKTIIYDTKISIGEDYLFVMDYLCNIKKISLGPDANYLYYRRSNSLSTSYNAFEEELLSEYLLYQSTRFFYQMTGYTDDETNISYIKEFKKHAYRALFSLYQNKLKNYSRTERIHLVENMSPVQLRRFQAMFRSNGLKGFLISTMFSKSMFKFSDTLFYHFIKNII